MFQTTSHQLSLFDLLVIFPGILPDDDWSYIYREKIHPQIDEHQFKHLYCEYWGAPNQQKEILPDLQTIVLSKQH